MISKFEEIVKNGSTLSKLFFFALRHIQKVVLFLLFINSSSDLNNFQHLGNMLFFVVYSTYESAYRKTGKLLTVFVSFFLFGQYLFALVYHVFLNNKTRMQQLEWLAMYETEKMPTWKEGDSIYFRHSPYGFDLFVLLLTCMLNSINLLYSDKKRVDEMQRSCYESIRNDYSAGVHAAQRVKNFLAKIGIFVTLALMLYFVGKLQTNLLTWILFSLNVLNIAWIAKGDNKPSTLRHSLNISIAIKRVASFILIS